MRKKKDIQTDVFYNWGNSYFVLRTLLRTKDKVLKDKVPATDQLIAW